MSNIVYLSLPAHGHVNPTLPVVQELVQRGEQVTYYSAPEFCPQIERTGATFRAYPMTEMTSTTFSAILQDGNLALVVRLLLHTTEQLVPFLLDELPREQPDLVVFDSNALWGNMAATLLKLRSAASIPHLVFDGTEARKAPHARQQIFRLLPMVPDLLSVRHRLIRRYGKAAFPSSRPLFPMRGGLNIVFTSRELNPDVSLIDQTFRFVGPSINQETRDGDFPFDALGQQPVVYISLGTVHSTRSEFYRQCFEAFAGYPAQFILSAGTHTNIKELGAIPPNFIVRPFVPQLEVLQHVDTFITHGGLNSVHEGLYYGVPLILIPQQLEQFLNAKAVAARGAGLVIHDQLMHGHVRASTLRQVGEMIFANPRYREAARALQKTLHATGGYRQAADEIQRYLAREGVQA